MRRVVVAVLMLAALLVVGCGSSTTAPVIYVQPHTHFVNNGRVGGPPPSVPAVGDILFTTSGHWSGSPTGFTYLWEDCDSGGANCTTAAGTPTNTQRYVIVGGDSGFTIRVKVTASYAGHPSSSVQSQPTGIVGGGGTTPSNTASPTVIDTTLLNNNEQLDTVQASAGTWTNSPTSYTYQFQDCSGKSGSTGTNCTNINTPQCSATSATTCSYTLGANDVGNYVVASVTATNGSGSSSPAASQAQAAVVPSRTNHFCNIPTAYNTPTTGPHLCGWPDSTNTGYANAPGYPGSLTVASSGSSTCPTTPLSNHTYSFCQWAGMSMPTNLTNVTFYGDDFKQTNPQNPLVNAGSGDNNITFDYDTFQPNIPSPTNVCAQSYQYGIDNEGGAMTGFTVSHSDFWGFGNAIDTSGSTQSTPQIFKYNYIHDVVSDSACAYHTDGIGYEGGVVGNSKAENYAIIDHNNIQITGNTQTIAWQEGTYSHKQDTNNLLSGLPYSVARCSGTGCTVDHDVSTGNTFSTDLSMSCCSTIDGTGSPWAQTGGVWQDNFWAVPPSAAYGSTQYNGLYWVPAGNSNIPADCGWVSVKDFLNYANLCTAGGAVPANTTQPYFTASNASDTDGTCQSGCAIVGQTLTVQPGVWSNNPTGYSYQWQDCTTTAGTDTGVAVDTGGASNIMTPPTTGSCSNITGATSSSYTIQAGDAGKALAVNVTATNSHGSATTSPGGACNTGLMTTTWTAATNPKSPITSTAFDNGSAGCSPISAVVGTAQYGTGTGGEHFCTNAPTTCGFADIANTGVPQGTALYSVPGTCTSPTGPNIGCGATGTGWSYASGQITLSSGATLQNVSFNSGAGTNNSVVFAAGASNVTIQNNDLSDGCNCQFQVAGGVITLTGAGNNITIQNNNLHGLDGTTAGDGCNAGVFGGASQTGVTIQNNDIYWCATGLNQVHANNGGWNIDENYIHDFAWGDSAKSNHFDGIQFEGGGSASSPTSFVNNTDLANISQTDAVILSVDDPFPPTNSYRWIAHDLLGGGSLSLYVTGNPSSPTVNSTFENIDFSQIYMGDHNNRSQFGAAAFGPDAEWTAATNTWTNNVWDDTGGTITPDTCTGVSPNFCP